MSIEQSIDKTQDSDPALESNREPETMPSYVARLRQQAFDGGDGDLHEMISSVDAGPLLVSAETHQAIDDYLARRTSQSFIDLPLQEAVINRNAFKAKRTLNLSKVEMVENSKGDKGMYVDYQYIYGENDEFTTPEQKGIILFASDAGSIPHPAIIAYYKFSEVVPTLADWKKIGTPSSSSTIQGIISPNH